MSEDAFELSVELTRGTKTDDRDKLRAKVSGDNIEELEERVDALKSRMESWAEDLRNIQPEPRDDKEGAYEPDEQQTELGKVKA